MGADGGIIYAPLRAASRANYARVTQLLRPFGMLTSLDGSASWADDAHRAWLRAHPEIAPPAYLVGLYGTDRVSDLGDLVTLCEPFEDWRGDLYALTWGDLDLECRTALVPVSDGHYEHPLRRLMYQHYGHFTREETLAAFRPLDTMLVRDWAIEVEGLLDLDRIRREETWT